MRMRSRAGYRFYSYGDACLLYPAPAMTDAFSFRLIATDGAARRGEIATPHGAVQTPAFMPVGTQATVKGVTPEEVRATGADILLGNTYHLMLRPGAERIAALGGLHKFMNWPRPILTDSGGFQVMSLVGAAQDRRERRDLPLAYRRRDGRADAGARDRDPALLGADIVMQLDECIKLPATRGRDRARDAAVAALGGALQARLRERAAGPRAVRHRAGRRRSRRCARRARGRWPTSAFHGYAIGGLAVGEPQEVMLKMIEETAPQLPADRPRYLMGVGTPDDLLEAVARGIDMFDCVMPTRNGRHGAAFTRFGPINLNNARHADDPRPLDEQSPYAAARTYSRAYLHHLVQGERDARRDAAVGDQSRLLPGADGGHARRDRAAGASPNSARRRAKAGRGAILPPV